MIRSLVVLALFPLLQTVASQPLPAFSHRENWEPQFGSKPVRAEELDDGTTCIALDAEFKQRMDRACWDWVAPLDLSGAGRITFEASFEHGGLAGNVGIYFGTPNGWYARFGWGSAATAWTPRIFSLDSFGTEGKPDGWDKVERFRFSVWSTGPGKTTFRLRNLRVLPGDPGENYLRNGSFETPGVGIPYAWGSGHWGVGHLPWAADMDLWRSRWHLDEAIARHGAQSLCLENSPELPLLKAQSAWLTPPKAVKKLALSAWLKSDRDGLPVTLTCGGQSAQVEAQREWRQAVLTDIPRTARMTVVIAPKQPGKLWIDAVQLQKCATPTPEFHPAFGDEAIAAREKLVEWSPPARTPEVAAGRSISGPTRTAAVSIDEHGRFLLDGKPYIQHSLGLEFISQLDILDFAARSGFNEVCVQVRAGVTTERLTEIFDRCARVGLRIIPWLDGRMSREQFTDHIEALKNHPALLCWYVFDEPSGERFAEADARYRLAKELDPNHPALINYLSSKLEDHTGDIYSTDVYPIPGRGVRAAMSAVARMKAEAAPEGKPVWMWLQGTGYAYWMDREPSPRELSAMVYGSLIEGARGIYYFAQIPRTKECFDEMRAMCVEVEALTPALCSLDRASEVTCDHAGILCRAYADEGDVWVLAVNTQGEPVNAKLSLPGATGELEVVFEGRALKAADGAWQDRFGAFERHVYRVRN